jgi:hypothetical protein
VNQQFSQSISPRTEKAETVRALDDALQVTSMLGAEFLALFFEPQTRDNYPHAASSNRLGRPSDLARGCTRSRTHSDCVDLQSHSSNRNSPELV